MKIKENALHCIQHYPGSIDVAFFLMQASFLTTHSHNFYVKSCKSSENAVLMHTSYTANTCMQCRFNSLLDVLKILHRFLTSLSFSSAFYRVVSAPQKLEIDTSKSFAEQLANIVSKEKHRTHGPLQLSWSCQAQNKPVSKDFVDDPDVPPLM